MKTRITQYPEDLFDPKKIEKENVWSNSNAIVTDDSGNTWNIYINNFELRMRITEETIIEKYGISQSDWDTLKKFQDDFVTLQLQYANE